MKGVVTDPPRRLSAAVGGGASSENEVLFPSACKAAMFDNEATFRVCILCYFVYLLNAHDSIYKSVKGLSNGHELICSRLMCQFFMRLITFNYNYKYLTEFITLTMNKLTHCWIKL